MTLGLKRGTVKLLPHDSEWAEIFAREKQLLKKTFGNTIIAIEHVGSTAIPGIPAKPIIDMNIGVRSLKIARNMKNKFKKIGYEYRPVNPLISKRQKKQLKWQELYVKGPESKRTHFAHVTVYNSDYWRRDLLFRDYLRRNPPRAEEYANLKRKLAKKYPKNRMKYTENKDKFIQETIKIVKKRLKRKTIN